MASSFPTKREQELLTCGYVREKMKLIDSVSDFNVWNPIGMLCCEYHDEFIRITTNSTRIRDLSAGYVIKSKIMTHPLQIKFICEIVKHPYLNDYVFRIIPVYIPETFRDYTSNKEKKYVRWVQHLHCPQRGTFSHKCWDYMSIRISKMECLRVILNDFNEELEFIAKINVQCVVYTNGKSCYKVEPTKFGYPKMLAFTTMDWNIDRDVHSLLQESNNEHQKKPFISVLGIGAGARSAISADGCWYFGVDAYGSFILYLFQTPMHIRDVGIEINLMIQYKQQPTQRYIKNLIFRKYNAGEGRRISIVSGDITYIKLSIEVLSVTNDDKDMIPIEEWARHNLTL